MLEAAEAKLTTIYRGGTWEQVVVVYEDEAQKEPLPLTPYKVRVTLKGVEAADITVTVTAAAGEIAIALSKATTEGLMGASTHYVIWLEEEVGAKEWPVLRGPIPIENA